MMKYLSFGLCCYFHLIVMRERERERKREREREIDGLEFGWVGIYREKERERKSDRIFS